MDSDRFDEALVRNEMIPVFIGGCDRSGTTLLGSLIGKELRAVVTPESQFKDVILDKLRTGYLDDADVVRAVHHWRLALWELDAAILARIGGEAIAQKNVSSFLIGLVSAYANKHGIASSVWIDHTPSNLQFAKMLTELFPGALFLHIVRDPRAVYASVKHLDWGPRTPTSAAQWWLSRLAFALAAEQALPGRILRVRFEDLVSEPRKTIENVRQFIAAQVDISSTPGRATDFLVPTYSIAQHRLVAAPPDASRIRAWRQSLTDREIAILEALLRDSLLYFGYSPEFPGAPLPNALELLRFGIEDFFFDHFVSVLRFRRRRRAALSALSLTSTAD